MKFSRLTQNFAPSDIDMLLKLTAQPEVISFGGGLPAPETFPIETLAAVTQEVFAKDGVAALQYGPSRGYLPLREYLSDWFQNHLQTTVMPDDILITAGSQQGLDLLARVFLDPGDVLLVEGPSYIGALNAFDLAQPTYVEMPMDEEGVIPEALAEILATQKKVKAIYVIPDFQNPTGITWSLERRQKFMELVNQYEIPVWEDHPYGELRFSGEALPTLKALDTKHLVTFLGTFSKTLSPGLRIGYLVGPAEVIERADFVKQAADLSTSSLVQRQVAAFLQEADYEGHVAANADLYRQRHDVMLTAMQQHFPADVHWTEPRGGLFIWVELPKDCDARDVLTQALQENVAFTPGEGFFPVTKQKNYFRLNYSSMDEARIREGIRKIGEVLHRMLHS